MKIETVIEKCKECKYRRVYSLPNNTHHLAVCTHGQPLLIMGQATGNNAFKNDVIFPDCCPLPDYTKPLPE